MKMKKYIIERDLPGAGNLSAQELNEISKTSCNTIDKMGKSYHWLETFVTANKLFCVHIAKDSEVVEEHSKKAGFPINSIREVVGIIDPTNSNK